MQATALARSMTNKIRVLIIDAGTMFRESIARLIGGIPDFHIVGCTGTVTEGLDVLRHYTADLVLLGSSQRPGGAITFLPRARPQGFNGAVVVLTSELTLAEGAAFVQQGVSAICPKIQDIDALLEAMQLAVQGVTTIEERYFRAATELRSGQGLDLTEREWHIIHHLMDGLSNKQIAARIGMSEATVKAGLRRVYDATGARSRSQLACILLDGAAMRQ